MGVGEAEKKAVAPENCLAVQEWNRSSGPRARRLRGGWATWILTVSVWDAWQPCIHPSLVDMSVQAQDIHLIVLRRRAGKL